MKSQVKPTTLVASIIFGAARVTLGILWLHEGIFKYTAHFGRADILLVVDSAKSNSRVPEYFGAFAGRILGSWPGLFGFRDSATRNCAGRRTDNRGTEPPRGTGIPTDADDLLEF